MEKDTERKQDRRELLTGALRHATLGLLAAVGGSVFVKRRRLVREGKCVNRGLCEDCEIFKECGLEQAISVRKAIAGLYNGRRKEDN